ncbi:hypothetical protein ACN2XU_00390 [Primorskyibacter sp. 2E107]|uniref:hypothetical protein n=1 Tax=Primorskyibacter sp. 2E107 TaxID=3403458 RepID=UPI003AF49DB5
MKNIAALLLSACLVTALPVAAHAECYVEYKAKQDSPLRLHYGILAIPGACPAENTARQTASARLASAGWVLLNVLGLSTTPPTDAMRSNAGDYYLRY